MLENAELKISKHKNSHSHILTQILLVNMTLKRPPTTLGENQFQSSLFLKKCFYSEVEITAKISATKQIQLISFFVLNHRLGICANSKIGTTINAVRTSLNFVPKNIAINAAVRPPRFACRTTINAVV